MHPAPICKFYQEGKCSRKSCFFKHPSDQRAGQAGPNGSCDGRDGNGGRHSSDGGDLDDSSRRGGNKNDKGMDEMEATVSKVLEAVQKLISFQANNQSIQCNNNLNQWLSKQ